MRKGNIDDEKIAVSHRTSVTTVIEDKDKSMY